MINPCLFFSQVLHQKTHKSLDEITNELCPVTLTFESLFKTIFLHNINLHFTLFDQVLSIAQIYRIGTMFWDDKYGTQGLSTEVLFRPIFTENL